MRFLMIHVTLKLYGLCSKSTIFNLFHVVVGYYFSVFQSAMKAPEARMDMTHRIR